MMYKIILLIVLLTACCAHLNRISEKENEILDSLKVVKERVQELDRYIRQ